jgi:hypothetical protein
MSPLGLEFGGGPISDAAKEGKMSPTDLWDTALVESIKAVLDQKLG